MNVIYLFQDENMRKANIETFIKKWNDLNEDKESFEVVVNPSIDDERNSDIWIINRAITDEVFKDIEIGIKEIPNLSICFFLEVKEMKYINTIEYLREKYTFSTIGTVMKPTQYSRVDNFLKSVFNKKDMVTFDDNFDFDFDFDID